MCNFLLADEINRASPKAQSSLLEVMEEQQISLDGETIPLPQPFMTLATQNPIETYGTYHLPEAQMDRFLMRITMGYPAREEEFSILERIEDENPMKALSAVLTLKDVLAMQERVQQVSVNSLIKNYILDIVTATRRSENILLGVSPRGSLALQKAAKALAFIRERDYVIPDDIQDLATAVLAHRVILSPKGKSSFASQEEVITHILQMIPVPLPDESGK